MNTTFTRHNPYQSLIKKRQLLSKKGSEKKVYHFVFDIKDSGITFECGDSASIIPMNEPEIVAKTIKALGAPEETTITNPFDNSEIKLKEFLTYKANISRASLPLLTHIMKTQKNENLIALLAEDDQSKIDSFIQKHELWDLLEEFQPIQVSAQEICNLLSPLMPRYYTIASSPKMVKDEIELIIALVSYETSGLQRFGVTTNYLCNLAKEGDKIPLYIQKAPHFHLPPEPNIPIIMVGPGVGIAPFRSFMQERLYTKDTGKNWLFFGEQRKKCDFYYEDFFHDLEKKKILRLDTAFSRDQDIKVYVQDKLYDNKKDIWKWLNEGAYFYVCGDAARMSKDVEKTLLKIAIEEGGLTQDQAFNFIKDLKVQKRYKKDVY